MANAPSNLFWDSCVFYAFLDSATTLNISGIEQYLQEAKEGKHRIYASSLIFAEVTPNAITKPGIGTIRDFINDLQGTVTIVNPSPDVMHEAALLKDLPYTKAGVPKGRRLSTTDAIMLTSCLEVQNVYGITIDAFHTFDNGKKRDPVDGKMVPLISYEEWCAGFTPAHMSIASPVISFKRCTPDHPSPKLVP